MKILKRTKQQRQNEVKTIIKKLNELHLNTRYDGIKLLFQNMKDYTNITNINNDTEEPILINIPCPELNILITGVLEIDLRKKVWVKLECLEKPIEE
jgi:hypothetical protein